MINKIFSDEQKNLWDSILNQATPSDDITLQFLTGKLDLDYLSANYGTDIKEKAILFLTDSILSTPIPKIKSLLKSELRTNKATATNIPQFSNFATATIYLPELLLNSQEQFTNRELGYQLFSETKSDGAAEKYGQNHANLAMQLGLASIVKQDRKIAYRPTPLTSRYCQLELDKKLDLLQRLCFRIPIIQIAVRSDTPTDAINDAMQEILAQSTYLRRKSNVLEILAFALGE